MDLGDVGEKAAGGGPPYLLPSGPDEMGGGWDWYGMMTEEASRESARYFGVAPCTQHAAPLVA